LLDRALRAAVGSLVTEANGVLSPSFDRPDREQKQRVEAVRALGRFGSEAEIQKDPLRNARNII
jgi:hypothetical protein